MAICRSEMPRKEGVLARIRMAHSIGSSTHAVIFGRLLAAISKANFDTTGEGATGHAHSVYFVVAGVRKVLDPYIWVQSASLSRRRNVPNRIGIPMIALDHRDLSANEVGLL